MTMSTTEPRTGFRLPWSGDAHRAGGSSPNATEADDASDTAVADGAGPDEPAGAETLGALAWPSADVSPTGSRPSSSPGSAQGGPEEGVDDATEDGEQPAADALAEPPEPTPAHDGAPEAVPPSPVAPTPAAPGPTPAGTRSRRDNPLVAGLVRAMREAAENARSETATRVAASATAQVEAIHHASAEEAEALRRHADEEIAGIREWSKAEMARIREETEARIARRRELLDEQVEAHAASVEHRIDAVRSAVASFEERMDAFFGRLLAEDDPARLATLAEQMPEPPDLEPLAHAEVAESATASVGADAEPDTGPGSAAGATTADASETDGSGAPVALDADDAAAAEAEALAAIELDDDALDDDVEASSGTPLEMGADHPVAERLAVLTTPVRGAATTADTVTQVTVVGLVNIASISIFKRALTKLPDVRNVSVTSGPDGDFVFAVTHGPRTDLAAAIPSVSGFEARITSETDGGIAVAARDPEA